MSEHAPFAPSAAERWLRCPGSFLAELGIARPTSLYAEEGTTAHAVFAQALLRNVSPYQLTEDSMMARPLYEAWLATKQLIAGHRFLVERKFEPMPGLPDLWGTADVIVFDRNGYVVMVIDLKFGSGVVVEPDTVQLRIYALLAAQQFGGSPAGITMVIVQPRALHSAGPVREHHYSVDALSAFLSEVQRGVWAALQPEAPRVSGLWCRFCAAKHRCPVRHHNLPQTTSSPFHQGRPSA
jgi:hypothetical protein